VRPRVAGDTRFRHFARTLHTPLSRLPWVDTRNRAVVVACSASFRLTESNRQKSPNARLSRVNTPRWSLRRARRCVAVGVAKGRQRPCRRTARSSSARKPAFRNGCASWGLSAAVNAREYPTLRSSSTSRSTLQRVGALLFRFKPTDAMALLPCQGCTTK
jgi:hypothetical protein